MSEWGVVGAVIATGVAIGLAWLWRGAEARAALLLGEKARLATQNEALGASLAREEKARKRQAEELAGYRKKADKARKRGSKTTPQPLGTASRIQDVETALGRAELERDRALGEQQALNDELARLRRQLEKASAKPEPIPPPAEVSASGPAETAMLEAQLEQSRARVTKLEAELREAGQNETRMRKRMANQEQLYASIRAELEVKKDRLRTQEEQLERLQALQVTMLD